MAIKVINECVSNKLSDEVATLEKKMELLFGNDMPGELSSMYQQFKDVLARY